MLKELIENSIGINELIEKYSQKHYSVSITFPDELSHLCCINISWKSTTD